MNIFEKTFNLLSVAEKKQACVLLVMVIIMSLLEMLGVASILPFIAVITTPEIIQTNILLKKTFETTEIFGITNNEQFIFFLGIAIFVLLIISLTFKSFTVYFQIRFVQMCEFNIGKRLLEKYLQQPYSWFLNSHSADLGKTILSEVNRIVSSGIRPLIELMVKVIVSITLIALLIYVDPKLAVIVGILISTIYGTIFILLRNYLEKIGKESLKNNQMRFKVVAETFAAIKEVKLSGLEEIFVKYFSEPAKIFAKNQSFLSAIGQLPRFILEGIVFGGIILMILYLMVTLGSFNDALPIVSLYVFAGYRLMPAMQQIYSSLAQITFAKFSVDRIYNDLKYLKSLDLSQDQGTKKILVNNEITLKNVYYSYPNSSRPILKDISLHIPARSTVGFIGSTGSGKTTTVDIILGLLEPQKGTLEVDAQVISKEKVRVWQRSLGYVPQTIHLADDTIACNIAFGVKPKDIDMKQIERVSKIAQINKFVSEVLPDKYKTTIGERGVRLSGGQRQRIGIARALYNNPKVLILDEATSALDNETEQAVMKEIKNISKDITIIIVTHRSNTVKDCDIIYKYDDGKIVDHGNYSELFENN
jgi:ABC-type multidrug transport system fused ATPase/permease subunit